MPWWLVIVAAVALAVLNYLLRPKVKQPKPDALSDFNDPTAEAGRPVPVVFGTITVKGLNVLWYGQKGQRTFKVKA